MTATLLTPHPIVPLPRGQKKFASLAVFENWLNKKETDYNYEFLSGLAIKKPAMKQNEIFMANFLTRRFTNTLSFKQGDALLPETDVYINADRKRIPDLAYFSAQQIKESRKGIKVVPTFVIELLSDSESYAYVQEKIEDYFNAGVKVVWYINSKTQKIHIYTSAKSMILCSGSDACSASPAIPDFELIVQDLFKEEED